MNVKNDLHTFVWPNCVQIVFNIHNPGGDPELCFLLLFTTTFCFPPLKNPIHTPSKIPDGGADWKLRFFKTFFVTQKQNVLGPQPH